MGADFLWLPPLNGLIHYKIVQNCCHYTFWLKLKYFSGIVHNKRELVTLQTEQKCKWFHKNEANSAETETETETENWDRSCRDPPFRFCCISHLFLVKCVYFCPENKITLVMNVSHTMWCDQYFNWVYFSKLTISRNIISRSWPDPMSNGTMIS